MERVSQIDDDDTGFESFEDHNIDRPDTHGKQKAMLEWNMDAVKEPRGFIKFIQIIIAIFAFATTCSHSTKTAFVMHCDGGDTTPPAELSFGYPYRLSSEEFTFTNCSDKETLVSPYGNYAPPSQFYVFIGVMAFLYSLGALVLYVCFDTLYRKHDQIPIADFIISAVFTVMWLISSSAWADGVSKVKFYTSPEELWITHVPECHNNEHCEVTKSGNFASLNVSIIFGFLNMLVWGGNLWFLFKETKWHKVQTEHPNTQPSETPQQI